MNVNQLKQMSPTASRQLQYEEWFQTQLGQILLASERQTLHTFIQDFFGYHLLEVPVSHSMPVGNGTLVNHRIVSVTHWHGDLPDSSVITEPHEMPFENDSMDVVLLHHVLDFSENPHQVLREAARVLVSGGHLVIAGFNPYSLWGLRKLMGGKNHAPWNGRFISMLRLEDWLTLLDFRVQKAQYDFYQPPINHQGWLQAFSFMNRWGKRAKLPTGAYYVLVAQKRVAATIKLKPRWRKLVNVGTIPAVSRVSREPTHEDR